MLHNPYEGATASQISAASDRNARLAKIAGRSVPTLPKLDLTYSIPNTPFGVLKVLPVQWVPPNIEPLYWHCMWFADLIAIRPPEKPHHPSIEIIQRIVAIKYGISKAQMIGERRTHNVVLPRQIAMYLAKTLTPRSLPEIGRRFGMRDHTTVLHAVRKIAARCVSDPVFAGEIEQLKLDVRR